MKNKCFKSILGVRLDNLSGDEAVEQILSFLKDGRQHYVVTPNPELVLMAYRDFAYKEALNSADLSLADGTGLIIAGWMNGFRLNRVTGSDTTTRLLPVFAENAQKVLLINWKQGLSRSEEIETEITKRYKAIRFSVVDSPKSDRLPAEVLEKINEYAPDILFISLGSPSGENILANQLSEMPSVHVGLSVGGSFEFLLGRQKRAPKFLRSLGLEWFWRLLKQPKRAGRIWNAVVVFMFYVLLDRVGIRKVKNEV